MQKRNDTSIHLCMETFLGKLKIEFALADVSPRRSELSEEALEGNNALEDFNDGKIMRKPLIRSL
jgi:hypothetical protein